MAQEFYPPGIDGNKSGPFFTEQDKLSGSSGIEPNLTFTATADFSSPPLRNGIRLDLPNGITIFPGGFPLYRNGVLVGAIGISGDGVDQDDIVGASGTHDFLAPNAIAPINSFSAERVCLTQNSRVIPRCKIDIVFPIRA